MSLVLIEQQPRRQQWTQQRAQSLQPLECLQQVAGMAQRMAGLTVVPRQQALPEQEAAVVGIEQAPGIGNKGEELCRTDLCASASDVFVEQTSAPQQLVAVLSA